jgi:hypothetical protein
MEFRGKHPISKSFSGISSKLTEAIVATSPILSSEEQISIFLFRFN